MERLKWGGGAPWGQCALGRGLGDSIADNDDDEECYGSLIMAGIVFGGQEAKG